MRKRNTPKVQEAGCPAAAGPEAGDPLGMFASPGTRTTTRFLDKRRSHTANPGDSRMICVRAYRSARTRGSKSQAVRQTRHIIDARKGEDAMPLAVSVVAKWLFLHK